VLNVLAQWQAGKLCPEEVEGWADPVEVRDDLDHDPAAPPVTNAIFDLANPELQGPLDIVGPTLCKKLGV